MPEEVHLGEHFWHDNVPFELLFVNDSSVPVTIRDIQPSCGCTVVDETMVGVVLEPGHTARIEGTFNTGPRVGHKKESIRVITDDGANHFGFVSVDIVPSYIVYPGRIKLKITDDPAPVPAVRFESEVSRIISIKADSPWLRGVVEGDRVLIHVEGDGLPCGRTRGTLILQTNDKFLTNYAVPVTVLKQTGIDFRPNRVFLLRGQAAEKQVIVRSELAPQSVECAVAGISFQVEGQTITVRCDDTLETGTVEARVVLSDGSLVPFKITVLE